MKVQNTSIYVGNVGTQTRNASVKTGNREQGGSVYAGNLNRVWDPIEQKKQQAKGQAMKIMGDAWEGEKKLDAQLDARRNRIKELQSEMNACNKEIQWFEEERTRLQEAYGVAQDSKEQQDLELLAKEVDAKTPGKGVTLTKEEREQLAQIKEAGLTEYQSRSLELKELAGDYEEQKYKLEKEIEVENAIISATKLERLKSNPMGDARQQAEAVMEAASKEIIGMVFEEGKEHVDEELEEKIEAAKEKQEKEELLEEKLEKLKEKKESQEEFAEAVVEVSAELIDMDAKQIEVKKELQEVMDKMKLLAEDIKGAKVDETV